MKDDWLDPLSVSLLLEAPAFNRDRRTKRERGGVCHCRSNPTFGHRISGHRRTSRWHPVGRPGLKPRGQSRQRLSSHRSGRHRQRLGARQRRLHSRSRPRCWRGLWLWLWLRRTFMVMIVVVDVNFLWLAVPELGRRRQVRKLRKRLAIPKRKIRCAASKLGKRKTICLRKRRHTAELREGLTVTGRRKLKKRAKRRIPAIIPNIGKLLTAAKARGLLRCRLLAASKRRLLRRRRPCASAKLLPSAEHILRNLHEVLVILCGQSIDLATKVSGRGLHRGLRTVTVRQRLALDWRGVLGKSLEVQAF